MASERLARAARLAVAATEQERAQAMAGYLERFGQEAPVWDVATPTYAEEPALLRARLPAPDALPPPDWRQTSGAVEAMLAPGLRPDFRARLALARTAVGLGEDDDWLYARTQAEVRRALLGLGRRLVTAGALAQAGDIFCLPFPLVRAIGRGERPMTDLAALAAAGHRAWQAALALPPPAATPSEPGLLRGLGTGGRAIGRAVLHRPSAPRWADAVLVARTLLPTELPLLSAVALVTETGGPLDHVAAQARERGIPAVVSALGATERLADGDPVLVDGDRGLVVKL
jgi:pyruvate,water dikinase